MFCWKCGAENEAAARFCGRCGTSLAPGRTRRRRVPWLWIAFAVLCIGILATAIAIIVVRATRPLDIGPVAVSTEGAPSALPSPMPVATTASTSAGIVASPTPLPTPDPTPPPTAPPLSYLEGQILDEASGQPLPGALVTAGDHQTTTDAQGRFRLSDLPPGQYTLLVIAADHDPLLSGIVALDPGEGASVDAALAPAGSGDYPEDPMASHQVDPAGAPTALDAERLARLQGFQGEVVSVEPVFLEGDYLVNYKENGAIRAAMATLHHPGWSLRDGEGEAWYIVRVCGNLALARVPGVEVPRQVVARPKPVVTIGEEMVAGYACPAEGCEKVADLQPGWHGVALACSPGCSWLRVQGPGLSGECWLRVDGLQVRGETATLPEAATSSLPDVRWSEPQLIGGKGQGGPTQQLLLDRNGRLWAFWEEHVSPGSDGKGYSAVHYRVWEEDTWGDLQDIPGSEGLGEPSAVLLPDGDILVKAEPIAEGIHAWFEWNGSTWSRVVEMDWQQPKGDPIRGVAADGQGVVHLIGYPIYTWDGNAWREGERLGTIYYYATAVDGNGQLHAVGRALPLSGSGNIVRWVWEGQAWSAPTTIYTFPTARSLGTGTPSLAFGPAGDFHIAWDCSCPLPSQQGMASCVCYGHGRGTQWSEPDVLFGPMKLDTGFLGPNVAVTPDGTVFVTWGDVKLQGDPQRGPYRVYVTWGRGHEWSEPIVLSPEDGYEHHWATVGVDAAGRVHVIWKGWAGVYHVTATIRE